MVILQSLKWDDRPEQPLWLEFPELLDWASTGANVLESVFRSNPADTQHLELGPDTQSVKHGLDGKGTLDVAMSKPLR